MTDYCASPVGANVHGIPSKYLAAFNAVAAVNGLPQAIGTPSQPIADPKMHVPVTTASIAAATGWGVNAIPVHKDPSNGRDCRGVPAMGVPALLGPLMGSSRVATGIEWQGFGGERRSNGVGNYGNPGVPFAGGITALEVSGVSERATRQWNALLQVPGPVGRRGWNHVGRDHLGNFSHGLSPVTNYSYR